MLRDYFLSCFATETKCRDMIRYLALVGITTYLCVSSQKATKLFPCPLCSKLPVPVYGEHSTNRLISSERDNDRKCISTNTSIEICFVKIRHSLKIEENYQLTLGSILILFTRWSEYWALTETINNR